MSSHFDEKSGVVFCSTSWGKWYQTAEEVVIEVPSPSEVRGRDVGVKITPSHILFEIKDTVIFEGELFDNVIVDESTWSVEDRQLVRILLAKSITKDNFCWKSLFQDGRCAPDVWTLDQMQRKLTLERYQIEHPGFDFSSAEISGNYISGGYHTS